MVGNNQFALSSITPGGGNRENDLVEAVAVLDVGKTHAKLSLIGRDGAILAVRSRANATPTADGRPVLDAEGIEAWALATLGELGREADLAAIVPVGHGAAAALVEGDGLAAPVMDYEAQPPQELARAYEAERDGFAVTGSPRLQRGLNLGMQLYWQEQLYPDLWPRRARALLWPQYWAWRLCGEVAAEVSSLGCHSDLWRPHEHAYSALAKRRGWADRFGPMTPAGSRLGPARGDLARGRVDVLCGVHDSNASLHAVRSYPEVAGRPFTLVSTGTWFVAFRTGKAGWAEPERGGLTNVDVAGEPVQSARFMGGREYMAVVGEDLGVEPGPAEVRALVERGVSTQPSFDYGGGPYPRGPGAISGSPATPAERAALGSLHLAMMTRAELDVVGAEGPVVIEGRFARDAVFPAALASLRAPDRVYACPQGGDGVALGAARLVWPDLTPAVGLAPVEPLPVDIDDYATSWWVTAHRNELPIP